MNRARAYAHSLAAACALWTLALAGGLGACGKSAAPTAPTAQLPPGVVGSSPPARSIHVEDSEPIWTQFDRALDPSTIDTRHVFLKVDTRRLPIQVRYESATHRILIDPGGRLALRTTHTVEFAPGLRAADGDSLGHTYFWQFTTVGIRRPGAPQPDDRAIGESPLSELLWTGTEASAGAIGYDVYASSDSAAVASHSIAPLIHRTQAFFVPDTRWSDSAPMYWAVRANNLETGESLDGPVWRFDVISSATPVDSVIVRPRAWGSGHLLQTDPYFYSQQCTSSEQVAAMNYDNFIHWNLGPLGPGIRVASGYLLCTPTNTYRDGLPHGLVLYSVGDFGTLCTGAASPYVVPTRGTFLAPVRITSDIRARFDGDKIAAFAEAAARHGNVDGTLFATSAGEMHLVSPSAAPPGTPNAPVLVLYIYRPGPLPAGVARR